MNATDRNGCRENWLFGKQGWEEKRKQNKARGFQRKLGILRCFVWMRHLGNCFFFFFNAREAPTGNAPVAGRNGFQEIVISLQAIPGDFARRPRGKLGEMDLAAPLGRSCGANPGWRQQQPCMSHGWRQKGRWGNSITADPTG